MRWPSLSALLYSPIIEWAIFQRQFPSPLPFISLLLLCPLLPFHQANICSVITSPGKSCVVDSWWEIGQLCLCCSSSTVCTYSGRRLSSSSLFIEEFPRFYLLLRWKRRRITRGSPLSLRLMKHHSISSKSHFSNPPLPPLLHSTVHARAQRRKRGLA